MTSVMERRHERSVDSNIVKQTRIEFIFWHVMFHCSPHFLKTKWLDHHSSYSNRQSWLLVASIQMFSYLFGSWRRQSFHELNLERRRRLHHLLRCCHDASVCFGQQLNPPECPWQKVSKGQRDMRIYRTARHLANFPSLSSYGTKKVLSDHCNTDGM
jgi:hypothetical protein